MLQVILGTGELFAEIGDAFARDALRIRELVTQLRAAHLGLAVFGAGGLEQAPEVLRVFFAEVAGEREVASGGGECVLDVADVLRGEVAALFEVAGMLLGEASQLDLASVLAPEGGELGFGEPDERRERACELLAASVAGKAAGEEEGHQREVGALAVRQVGPQRVGLLVLELLVERGELRRIGGKVEVLSREGGAGLAESLGEIGIAEHAFALGGDFLG